MQNIVGMFEVSQEVLLILEQILIILCLLAEKIK